MTKIQYGTLDRVLDKTELQAGGHFRVCCVRVTIVCYKNGTVCHRRFAMFLIDCQN